MPNKKSAIKELKKSKKRHAVNKVIKEDLKDSIKKLKKAIEAKEKNAKELLEQASKALDKAAQKRVIKKNTSNRKKSRLHRAFNKSLDPKAAESQSSKSTKTSKKNLKASKTSAKSKK